MMGFAAFVGLLVLMFALKALSIAHTADDMVCKSTAFSWLAPKAEDAQVSVSAQVEVEPEETKRSAQVHAFRRRPNAA